MKVQVGLWLVVCSCALADPKGTSNESTPKTEKRGISSGSLGNYARHQGSSGGNYLVGPNQSGVGHGGNSGVSEYSVISSGESVGSYGSSGSQFSSGIAYGSENTNSGLADYNTNQIAHSGSTGYSAKQSNNLGGLTSGGVGYGNTGSLRTGYGSTSVGQSVLPGSNSISSVGNTYGGSYGVSSGVGYNIEGYTSVNSGPGAQAGGTTIGNTGGSFGHGNGNYGGQYSTSQVPESAYSGISPGSNYEGQSNYFGNSENGVYGSQSINVGPWQSTGSSSYGSQGVSLGPWQTSTTGQISIQSAKTSTSSIGQGYGGQGITLGPWQTSTSGQVGAQNVKTSGTPSIGQGYGSGSYGQLSTQRYGNTEYSQIPSYSSSTSNQGNIALSSGNSQGSQIHAFLITKEVPIHLPVPVPVPVERKVPVAIHVPTPVRVEKPVPIYIDRPSPYLVEKPVPVHVKVPVRVPVHVPYKVPVFIKQNVPFIIKEVSGGAASGAHDAQGGYAQLNGNVNYNSGLSSNVGQQHSGTYNVGSTLTGDVSEAHTHHVSRSADPSAGSTSEISAAQETGMAGPIYAEDGSSKVVPNEKSMTAEKGDSMGQRSPRDTTQTSYGGPH